jgi:hypothetical protein
MQLPVLSVLIPTYNRQDSTLRAIESALDQRVAEAGAYCGRSVRHLLSPLQPVADAVPHLKVVRRRRYGSLTMIGRNPRA